MEALYGEVLDQAISQWSMQRAGLCISLLLDAVCGWVLGICIQAIHHSREALRCIHSERGVRSGNINIAVASIIHSCRAEYDLVASLVDAVLCSFVGLWVAGSVGSG